MTFIVYSKGKLVQVPAPTPEEALKKIAAHETIRANPEIKEVTKCN